MSTSYFLKNNDDFSHVGAYLTHLCTTSVFKSLILIIYSRLFFHVVCDYIILLENLKTIDNIFFLPTVSCTIDSLNLQIKLTLDEC